MASRGLRYYTIATLVGFGIVWASGIYLALIGYRGNPAQCTSTCLFRALPAGIGWLLVLLCGYRALKMFILSQTTVKRVESLETGAGPEEKRIIAITNEIQSQRSLKRRFARRPPPIDTLAWSDRQAWDSAGLRWEGFKKPSRLVLSKALQGRLGVDDWRTLTVQHDSGFSETVADTVSW